MNLVKELKKKGFTKWKISKAIEVSWQTINMWEKEVFKPTPKHQEALEKLYKDIA